MTTAHRPTWRSAMGGTNQGGNRVLVPSRMYSAKDPFIRRCVQCSASLQVAMSS